MFQKIITLGTLCSALFIIIAIYFNFPPEDELNLRLKRVLQGLIDVENKFKIEECKVAVGYGACNDLFVDGKEFLSYDNFIVPEHFNDINTLEELKKSFGYFFRHGAAAERYVSNSSLFDELVAAAARTGDARYALGGNAPLMAQRLSQEGCQVLLAATLTPRLKASLSPNLQVVGGRADRDDVHLILEYKAGDAWGPYVAPRANRLIIHNDDNNPLVSSLEEFQQTLRKFNANLLVISGLQMMDNYPFQKGERRERLLAIREQMKSQSSQTRVHFEMASFTETQLLQHLMELIIPHADSLGMNEQELDNMVSLYQYGNVTLVADSTPRVAIVLDQMRHLIKLVHAANRQPDGRVLTRIHVHTLAYQAIMTLESSPWPHSDIAAAKASLTAHRHVCATSQVNTDKAHLIMDDSFSVSRERGPSSDRVVLEPQRPVSCWREPPLHICVAPVLICKESVQTAGGGDNISAAALAMQL